MDKKTMARIAALKAILASQDDPKNIAGMTDAVGTEEPNIASLVEKIMSKMDAKDGAGKYHLASSKRKAIATLLKVAFGEDMMGGGAPAPEAPMPPAAPPAAPPAPSPMDTAMGENPADEVSDMANPAIAPVEQLEEQNSGDPILDALLNVVEMLLKDKLGEGSSDDEGPGAGAPPPFAKKEDDGGGESEPSADKESKPAFPPKKEEGSDEDKEDDGEPEEKEEEAEPSEEKMEAEAELFLLRKKVQAVKAELAAANRVKALLSLPKEARLEKAASYRKLADAMEKGEMPDFESINKADKEDEKDMDAKVEKNAGLKNALKAVLAAFEAGKNDDDYVQKADPKDEEKVADKISKDDDKKEAGSRRDIVLAHLAKLRIQKKANTESQPTPKEVPKPIGTTEDNDKSDVKVQYQGIDPETAQEIQTKKVKVPGGNGGSIAGEAKEIYQGNDPESAQEVQSEKDSSKGVNNKKKLPDMGTAVQPDHPVSPTEYEMGAGSHQKAKDWEKAKSESDTTPTGPRLVGLAEAAKRALNLARLAESKGMVQTAEQFDELLEKYASYADDEVKLATIEETLNGMPARSTRKASDATFVENDAVEKAEEEQPETPSEKVAAARMPKGITRKASSEDDESEVTPLRRPLSMNGDSTKSGRFANLKGLGWTTNADPDDENFK